MAKRSPVPAHRAVILALAAIGIIFLAAGAAADYATIHTPAMVVTPLQTYEIIFTPPPYLYVTVTSQPSGATVWVDGSARGKTPATVYLFSAGNHSLNLTLAGYQDYAGWFTVPAQEGPFVTLSPVATTRATPPMITIIATPVPYLYFTMESRPSGATVWVDGIERGTTPAKVYLTHSGSYTCHLSLEGYEDYTGQYTAPGPDTVTVPLVPIPAPVDPTTPLVPVTPTPTGAADPLVLIAGSGIAFAILAGRKHA